MITNIFCNFYKSQAAFYNTEIIIKKKGRHSFVIIYTYIYIYKYIYSDKM